jgi:hypothetical protein
MTSIERFLKRQSDALGSVRDRRSLSDWHRAFATEWSGQADLLSAALNAEFDLGGPFAIRPDVGYIAVERREAERSNARMRLLLVSANPGWHEVTNPIEARLKHGDSASIDAESYERFRTEFFPRWYAEVMQPHRPRGAAWWNHARIFLHEVAGLAPPNGTCSLAPELDVIGWELWPFHSTRDGLTGAVFERAEDSPSALVEFAKASLRAACCMDVDGLIIASSAGFDLFVEHLADNFEHGAKETIGKIECAAFRERETGRQVVAVRRQLFSGFGVPSRTTRREIAAFTARAFARSASFSAANCEAVAPERRSEPEYEPLRVSVVRTADVAASQSPVIALLVPVSGVPDGDAPLNALDRDDDEDAVHERVGGYWRSTARVEAIGAALASGRRVLIGGYAGAAIVRMLEIRAQVEAQPSGFTHARSGEQWLRLEHQPECVFVRVNGRASTIPFATAYAPTTPGPEKVRFRYHTFEVDDDALIGRKLISTTALSWQTGFFAEFVGLAELPAQSDEA